MARGVRWDATGRTWTGPRSGVCFICSLCACVLASGRLRLCSPLAMSARLSEVVSALQSSDVRVVSSAVESLYKGMQTDGFNRLQNAQGQGHRDKQGMHATNVAALRPLCSALLAPAPARACPPLSLC